MVHYWRSLLAAMRREKQVRSLDEAERPDRERVQRYAFATRRITCDDGPARRIDADTNGNHPVSLNADSLWSSTPST